MRIYRVEHKDTRRGPFISQEVFKSVFERAGICKLPVLHTSYYDITSGLPGQKHDYRLAVRNLHQLGQWFGNPDVKAKLSEYGFIVSVYAVRKVLMKDSYQVIVHLPAHKLPVARFHLTDIIFDSYK